MIRELETNDKKRKDCNIILLLQINNLYFYFPFTSIFCSLFSNFSVKTVKITLNSASLQWKIISSGIGNFAEISSYNVSLVNKKEQYERNRLIDTSEMNFSNLSPNTSYIVKIFGLSAEGERLVSGTVVLTTLGRVHTLFLF